MMLNNKQDGFTLVELMVASAIFIGVLAFVGGAFSLFVGKQRAQINQQILQTEIQNFFEVIERDVKTSYGETFPDYDASSARHSEITFMNQEQKFAQGTPVESKYQLKTSNGTGRIVFFDKAGNEVALTSDRIDIKGLNFKWNKPQTLSGDQRYLTGSALRLTAVVNACVKDDAQSCVVVQSTMSSQQTKPLNENP